MQRSLWKWKIWMLCTVLLAGNLSLMHTNRVDASSPVPSLLITELLVNPPGAAPDLHEFVELYNNSNVPVSMQDYAMTYAKTDGSSLQNWSFADNKVLQPYQSIVVWVRNVSTAPSKTTDPTSPKIKELNDALTYSDFLTKYGQPSSTNLTSVESNGGMVNSDTRTLTLVHKASGQEIVKATYAYSSSSAAPDGKADFFSYPVDGSIQMLRTGNGTPTPGSVDPSQVPDPIPPDNGGPSGIPALLLTEIVTNPAGPAPDLYDMIELYNNSDLPISPTGYSITSLALNGASETWEITEDKLIQPRSAFIVRVKNATANANASLIDFLQFYRLQLRESGITTISTNGGLVNSDTRTLIVRNGTGQEVVQATYTTTEGTPDGKSIRYKFPEDGTDTMQLMGLADVPTPGAVDPLQVPPATPPVQVDLPPGIIHSPIASTERTDVTVTAYVYDETPIGQITLAYSTNADSDDPVFRDLAMQQTSANPFVFQAVIPQSDLQHTTRLHYHITATDSQNETSRIPANSDYMVQVNAPAEPDSLSFNLSENQFVNGKVQVNGRGGSLSDLQLQLDGQTVSMTENVLARPAKVMLEGSGMEGKSQGMKNGVYVNDQLIQVIPEDILNYATYEVPVPGNVLRPNGNKITIRAGNTESPDDLSGNHDDFSIRNVRLVLGDGTQLTDPSVTANQTFQLGDGFPPNPATAVLSKDFHMAISGALAKTIVYDWDTTAISDGPHELALTDLTGPFAPIRMNVRVDNTLPDLTIQSPIENRSYKGTIPLTLASNDSGSGMKSLELTLDGVPIDNVASLRAVDLKPGTHVLQARAEDHAGNVTAKEVHFTSLEEQPLPPHAISPGDNAGNVPTNPVLKVKIEDPTGDALDATFFRAYKYDFKDGLNHAAYSNATDTEPPGVMAPEGETRLNSDSIGAISAVDGNYMTTDDTEKYPYQRFEFTINDELRDAATVDAIWNGRSLPGRRVALYGWNYTEGRWQELDARIASDENDFTLRGAIQAADMVRGNKANLLVQDLIPSAPQMPDQYDFSFVWMPDTQFYSKSYPNIYDTDSQWIVDHAAEQKIKYVLHTGDIVDDGFRPEQWANADKSMKILDDAGIPYGVVSGNHDVQPNADKPIDYREYVKWFGADRFADRPYYGGQFRNNRDHFDLISVNGHDFVIVYLGWQPEQQDLDWADGVLKKYADRNAIIAIHQFIDGNGRYGGAAEEVRKQLIIPNKNVFLVINGHHTNTPTYRTEQFGDRVVHEVFANYQTQPEGGMGYLRLMKFDTANQMLYMNTYSPYKDDYNWFAPSVDELALPVKLLPIQKRVATDYISIQARTNEIIGRKVVAAPSGSEVSTTWNGLQNRKLYNWFVRVEDAYDGVTESDIYTFTTGDQTTPPTTPPEGGGNSDNGGSGDNGGTPSNSGMVAADKGGTVTSNGAAIDVPPGAMDSDIRITVDRIRDTSTLPIDDALALHGDVYEIKKNKEGEFQKPVVITLPFDKSKVDMTNSEVGVYWFNEQTRKWVALDDWRLDVDKGTVSGSVTHFTKFAVLISAKKTEPQQPGAVKFTDIAGHWAEAGIRELVRVGAIHGYPDNSFKPNHSITRAEFVTVLVKAFDLQAQGGTRFADTGNHWAEESIAAAAAHGLVAGYSDTAFGPDDRITREQMAAIVVRAAKIESADPSLDFVDSSSVSVWAREAIAAAAAQGLIAGYQDGTVKPRANTTRAEAATVILKALQLRK